MRDLSVSFIKAGDIYKILGNTKTAGEYYESSLKISEELLKRNPESSDHKWGVSASCQRLGDVYKDLGDTKTALEYYESSLKISEELLKSNPDLTKYARGVFFLYNKLVSRQYIIVGYNLFSFILAS